MYELIHKRLHANNPDAPPYKKPEVKTSFYANSTHIAKFAVRENNTPIDAKQLTPAFEDLQYSKLVYILKPSINQVSDFNQLHSTENRTHLQNVLKIDEHEQDNLGSDVTTIRKHKALIEIDHICNSRITGVVRLVQNNVIEAIVHCIKTEKDPLIQLFSLRCLSKILRLNFAARNRVYKDRNFFMSIYEALIGLYNSFTSNQERNDDTIQVPPEYQCSSSLKEMKFSIRLDCMRYIVRVLCAMAHHTERGSILRFSRGQSVEEYSSNDESLLENTGVEQYSSSTPTETTFTNCPSILQYLVNEMLKQQTDGVVLIETLNCIQAYVSTHATARDECLSLEIMKELKSLLVEAKHTDGSKITFRYGPDDMHDDDLVNHPRLPNNEIESSNVPFLSAAPYTQLSLISHTCSCIAALSFHSAGTKSAIATGCLPELIYWMDFPCVPVKDAACQALMYLTLDIQGKRDSFQMGIVEKLSSIIVNTAERSSTKLFVLSIIAAISHLPEAKKKLKPLTAVLQNMRSTIGDAPYLRKDLDEKYKQVYACLTYTV